MTEEKDLTKLVPRVPQMFEGKSLFVTGAAGYLGVVLLELLLTCCPGIRRIYILLREKKGIQPECRKSIIFKKKIFHKLRQKQPELMDKVHVIAGDVSLPNLGMSQEDYDTVTQEVTLVYHLAACISFMKPLKFMLTQNVLGTFNVLNLCRQLKKLECVLYTSTAYSNSNRIEIEELIYRLPFPAQRFLDELKNGSDETLKKLTLQCQPAWPNYYTFSKCLAENLILDNSDLPIAIIRPSIIISCWKGSLPGYVEEGSGMVDIAIGVGKGFIRVLNCDPDHRLDIVPVDVVANLHVVSTCTVMNGGYSSPFVVNCITSDTIYCTMDEYTKTLLEMSKKHPLPKSYQKQSLTLQKNSTVYWMISLWEHYIPAYTIDMLLQLTGRKPRLVSLYRFLDFSMGSVKHFLATKFYWEAQNIKKLAKELHPEDRENFYLDFDGFSVQSMAESIPSAAPFYEWGIDKKPIAERKRVTQTRYVFITFIKLFLLFCTCLVFSVIFTQIKRFEPRSYMLFL